jgi:spore cortex formation protein SpoVR/YcgB (stage V sporulation)
LDNIAKESITDLSIYYNTSLSTCEIKSVCDYLANPNGEVTVYLNDIGCESQEEIIDSCEAHAGIIDGSSLANGLLIFPNPTSTTITIELPTQPSKNTSLTISNTNGQQLISQPITKPQTEIDISYLPVGIYIVKVWNDENVMVRKVVKQ